MQAGAGRASLALGALLGSCLLAMAAAARAEQPSVEAAAKAAGVAVETGTAIVGGVAIHYRDMGPRAEPVILLHGFPETGDAFAPARQRLVITRRMLEAMKH